MLHHGVKSGEKYPTKVRHFCLGLVTYSTRAYEFVRKTFNNHLPAVRTIQAWFSNSDIRGEPGIQEDTMERLQKIATEFREKNGRDLLCSLIFDEMHLRQQVLFSMEKMEYVGYANYGQKPGHEQTTVAKQAIVFLLNGIEVNFEFPVLYNFIDDLDMHARKKLIEDVIAMVTRCGIRITNITFDGYSANIPAMELLGAKLKINFNKNNQITKSQWHPYIINPINGKKIHVILDPCHMEKLVRNRWATCQVFYDSAGEKIEWRYVEALYEYSLKHDFKTHKLTKRHMQWKRNMMNVQLAVETFSSSVACSMEYLMNLGVPEFQGAKATVAFIKRMDNLFNIFNSRHCNGPNIFKRRMSKENKRVIYDFIDGTIKFFKSLKTENYYYKNAPDENEEENNENTAKNTKKTKKKRVVVEIKILPILKTRHRTGFLGFIIAMESLKLMYDEYVEESQGNQVILNIPTYCLLQDPLEMLFGRIRACGGCNNNPNVLEFKGAYRRIQCNMRMDLSPGSNCRMFDMFLPDNLFYSNIYFVSSKRARVVMDSETYEKQKKSILDLMKDTEAMESNVRNVRNNGPGDDDDDVDVDDVDSALATQHILDGTSQFMTAYIASQIERKIINCKNFYCNGCRSVFSENEKATSIDANFLSWTPCKTTTEICSHAEKFVKMYNVHNQSPQQQSFDFKVLYCLIFRTLDFSKLFSKSKFECDISHKYQFIKCIIGQYVAIRAHQISKQFTLERRETIIRQQYHRLTNFMGQ